MSFQIIVAIVATVILIGSLTFIGYAMWDAQHNATFPPVISACPDYWTAKDNNICINSKNLGNPLVKSKDFSDDLYKGDAGLCRQKEWANAHNLSWDGITGNNDICKGK